MTTGVPSVSQALEQVAAWNESQLAENQTKINEVDGELSKLRTTLANLQEQLTSLETVRTQLEGLDLAGGVVSRSYDAVFSALRTQAAELSGRASVCAGLATARRDSVYAQLGSGELAPLVEEFKQFKEQVEPTLSALPESYRAAISQHHIGVSERIRSALAAQLDGPVAVEASTGELAVDLVFGVDAPEGNPEVLICVLPIPDVTFTEWAGRSTDLTTLVGARVAQALYETTKRTGPPGAQAIRGGHQGLLAMEVDLEGASADFPARFLETLGVVLGNAPELAAAKVRVLPRQVEFDFLLPPEDPEGVE